MVGASARRPVESVESTAPVDVKVNAIDNLAYVRGRGRPPADVGRELLDVLGDACRLVVCDLSGMAAASVSSIVEAFTPAGCYLSAWRGTALVVYVPDKPLRLALFDALVAERILVPASLVTGTIQTRAAVPMMHAVTALLPPCPSAAPQARRIALRALSEWHVEDLADASALVTTELVTNAVMHAQTPLELTMVHAGDQVRLAVRDRGGGRAASNGDNRNEPGEESLHGRGLALVEAYTDHWGVLPARRLGKTVWAVLESRNGHASLGRSA
jgi:hypothetical protein